MSMEVELMKAMVDMVRAGGSYAVWGVIAWCGFSLLKITVIGGTIWSVVHSVGCTSTEISRQRLDRNDKQTVLLGEHMTTKLSSYLDNLQTTTKDSIQKSNEALGETITALKKFQEAVEDSKAIFQGSATKPPQQPAASNPGGGQ